MASAALITGGAARLGQAMALRLAKRGTNIVVHYANSDKAAQDTVEAARALGVRAVMLQADLLEPDAVAALVPRAAAALEQPLDILVNNASIFEYDRIETLTPQSWDRHIDSNLRAPVFLTQYFAAQAPQAGNDGEPVASANVINMIDQRVRKLTPEFMTYTLAKAGLWAFTKTAAQGLAPQIRVNAIGPGPTLVGARQSEEHFVRQRNATILQRGSSPEEICRAMEFILDSPGFTGQLLCMDGGQHLAWQTPDIQGPE
ncbi:MAG: SDR family oxidoreductase [Rhodobacteraceae bacterium]|nr:SDR family oxidoreductase [Paracoccaceae bacterium]